MFCYVSDTGAKMCGEGRRRSICATPNGVINEDEISPFHGCDCVKNKKFEPATINVPADKPFKLIVQNSDSTPMEIESHKPRFEKVIAPGATATIKMKPLKAGTYSFYDDFNKSNKGEIVAK